MNYQNVYRIDMNAIEFRKLRELVERSGDEELIRAIKRVREIKPSIKKAVAAAEAAEAKSKIALEKIQNAVNLLKLEGKRVTPYLVAKTAGISYNTAKKYQHYFTPSDELQ